MNNAKAIFNNKELHGVWRDEADESVWAEIFRWREYRAAEPVIMSADLPVLDLGGHAGFFVLYARALNPGVTILSVEPEKGNLKAISAHIKQNVIDGVKIVPGAIGVASGKGELHISEDSHNHTVSEGATGDVKVYSLKDLAVLSGAEQFSLVKMDIEGAEFNLLQNWTDEDYSLFQYLIMEYHEGKGGTHTDAEEMLRQHGFSVSVFPSRFDKHMGIIFARNKRLLK